MPRLAFASVPALFTLLGGGLALAQRGGGDWTTSANDAQRSSWVRGDAKISIATMRKPGFQLVWKLKLNNTPRQLNSLTSPALLDFYIGYRGFRTLGFVGGSSDTVIGIDTDIARIEWESKLATSPASASATCPGGLTSAVARPSFVAYPTGAGIRTIGRGTPAKSGVGEPFEGAVTLKNVVRANAPAAPKPIPAPAGSGSRRTVTPPSPFAPVPQYVYAISGDGKLHALYVSNGEEPKSPIPFIPAGANASGLLVFDNVAYVATSGGCGGAENGLWALDLETKNVAHWKSGGNGIAGWAGPAAGPDGTLYVAGGGGELAALEPVTLKPKASFKAPNQEFTSSPVVFPVDGKDYLAVTTNDGGMLLLDSTSLSGGTPVAKTPAFSAPGSVPGALATWQDVAGTRWILAPSAGAVPRKGFRSTNGTVKNGAIVAWKVVEQDGKTTFQPGWISRDMVSPMTPMIVNGVIFAVSTGEYRDDPKLPSAERIKRSTPAVLYALDPITGNELWNSGNTIASFVHAGALAAGGGRVYVSSHDGTQYAFGFPMEH